MSVFMFVVCFSFYLINPILSLSIPGENVDKQQLTSMGIKTIGWQDEERDTKTYDQLQVHHNYSKVSVQRHDDNYQTLFDGQGQVNTDLHQLQLLNTGQTTVDENNYFDLSNQQEEDHTLNKFVHKHEIDQSEKDGQEKYSHYGQLSVSKNEQIYNAHSYGPMLDLNQIVEAENKIHHQQNLEDFFDYGNVDLTADASNNHYQGQVVQQSNHDTYVKYTPNINQNKVARQTNVIETYTKCPKLATGQFVYASSCNQFLNCWKGRGFLQNCAPGTLFNPRTLECDFASKVQCVTGPREFEHISYMNSNEKLQLSCPTGFSGVIPHRSDCSKFINCADGVEHVMDCPPGTLFNLKVNNCDFPYNSECASWSVEFGGINYDPSKLKSTYSDLTILDHSNINQGNYQNSRHDQKYVSTDDFRYSGQHGSASYNQMTSTQRQEGQNYVETQLHKNENGPNQDSLSHYLDNNKRYDQFTGSNNHYYQEVQNSQNQKIENQHLDFGSTQQSSQSSLSNYGDYTSHKLHNQNAFSSSYDQQSNKNQNGKVVGNIHNLQSNTDGASYSQMSSNRWQQNVDESSQNSRKYYVDDNGWYGQFTGSSSNNDNYQAAKNLQNQKVENQYLDFNINQQSAQNKPSSYGDFTSQNSHQQHAFPSAYDQQSNHNQEGKLSNIDSLESSYGSSYGQMSTNQWQQNVEQGQGLLRGKLGNDESSQDYLDNKGFGQFTGSSSNNDNYQAAKDLQNQKVENQYLDFNINQQSAQNKPSSYVDFTSQKSHQQHTFPSAYDQQSNQNQKGKFSNINNLESSYGSSYSQMSTNQQNVEQGQSLLRGKLENDESSQDSLTHYLDNKGFGQFTASSSNNDNYYQKVQNTQSQHSVSDINQQSSQDSLSSYGDYTSHKSHRQDHSILDSNQLHYQNQNSKLKNNIKTVNPNYESETYQKLVRHDAHTFDGSTNTHAEFFNKCPEGVSGLHPHPVICSKFLNCANGQTFIQDCGPGTVFNPDTKVCDFPYKVKCYNHGEGLINVRTEPVKVPNRAENTLNNKQTDSDNNNYGKRYEHTFNQNNILFATIRGSIKMIECPVFGDHLYPHPIYCSKYVMCNKERTCIENCNRGLLYNFYTNYCDFANNVKCSSLYKTNPKSTEFSSLLPIEIQHHNSPNTKAIETVVLVECSNEANGVYSHPLSCSKYIECKQGRTCVLECAKDFSFNHLSKTCEPSYKFSCKSYKQVDSINIKILHYNGTHHRESEDLESLISEINYQTSKQYYLPSKSETQVKCPDHVSGLHPHPTICSKFLNCANGQTFIQDCGPGTVFNPISKVCDYPYNVNCESRHEEGLIDIGAVPQTHTFQKPSNNLHQNVPNSRFNQHTQEIANIHFNQHRNKSSHVSSVFPTTDLNADYEFGNGDAIVEVGAMDHKFNILTSTQGNNKKKHFCESLDFHCSLNDCIPRSMVCDGIKDCSNGQDEVDCKRYLMEYKSVSNSFLAVREKEKYQNISLIYCAKSCLESKGFQCKSFSYRKDDRVCFLSDLNEGLSGSLISSYSYNYYEVKVHTINCSNLYKCPNNKCISYKKICDGVNDCNDRSDEKGCNSKAFGYEIKLKGSDKKNEGRIEIKAFGKTGYVCDDKFGLRDADVVCREVGFPLGAVEVKSNSYFAQDLNANNVLYLMDDVACIGNETSLRDCDFNGWGVSNCESQEVVGVVCKTLSEVCPKDHWKCETSKECVPIAFLCDDVFDCTDQSDEYEKHCSEPVQLRLVNGKSKSQGRIEIKYHGIWGTVCDDDFNDDSAKVVCKQLGYPGKAIAKKDGYFGEGSGPIWLDQVFCQGNETGIQDCVHWNWGEHNCEHSEDVGVICNNVQQELEEFGIQRNVKLDARFNNVLPDDLFPERCGIRKNDQFLENDEAHFKVISGYVARKGDYPWQASLRIKNKSKPTHWCGAVIISPRFVLTAAHCLKGFSKGSYIVVAGDYYTDDAEGTEQEAYIDEFYIHEDFRKGQKMNNDIALIKLKGNGFIFTKDVMPICLPESDLPYAEGHNCTISGFGSIQSGKSGYSHNLRAGWIPLLSKEICQMPHVYGSAISDGMVCAGSLDEGIDACDGDSGGPLACLHDGLFTLYGITSWGHHCGHANKPGVYVKVSYYRNWIDEIIKNNS